jgi:hypothetical protein
LRFLFNPCNNHNGQDIFSWLMPKDIGKRRGRGRPAKGKVKVTFKLAPQVAAALEKAKDMTGRGKSQLVEDAIIAYLHLSSQEGSSAGGNPIKTK